MTWAGMMLMVVACHPSFAQESDALRIDVTMDEYSFSPDPLRVPAGREVTLVIRNVGRVSHEFMAGRDPSNGDFGQDLFAGLHVNIERLDAGGSDPGSHAEHAEHAEHSEHAEHAEHDEHAEHHAGSGAAGQAESSDHHVHGEGHAHGTMVEAEAGEAYTMTFTLPEDRRGEWMTGCFLTGHYEAGMHGRLIVE